MSYKYTPTDRDAISPTGPCFSTVMFNFSFIFNSPSYLTKIKSVNIYKHTVSLKMLPACLLVKQLLTVSGVSVIMRSVVLLSKWLSTINKIKMSIVEFFKKFG